MAKTMKVNDGHTDGKGETLSLIEYPTRVKSRRAQLHSNSFGSGASLQILWGDSGCAYLESVLATEDGYSG